MSKSYGNAVFLSDPPKEIDQKISRMMTDPARVRRTDPGEPEKCPAFQLHKIYCTPEEIEEVSAGLPQRRHRLPGLQEDHDQACDRRSRADSREARAI